MIIHRPIVSNNNPIITFTWYQPIAASKLNPPKRIIPRQPLNWELIGYGGRIHTDGPVDWLKRLLLLIGWRGMLRKYRGL